MGHLVRCVAGSAVIVALLAGTAWGIDIETITIAASVLERLTLVFSGSTLAFGELAPTRGPTTLPRGLTFNVKSNSLWVLEVIAADDLRNLQRPGVVMPAERLLLRRVGEGAFQPASKTVQRQVAVGQPTPAQGVNLSFDLQLAAQWEDQPGNYQTTLRFILHSRP